MELSVIIVNYNVRYFLDNCLRSVMAAMNHVDGEVIVVDNASSDDSPSMVREKYPNVQYHYLENNLGFSKGNNYGIERSKGEFVLLLNPDTLVAEDTFVNCLKHLRSHPEAAGLGVHMIEGHGRFLPESKRGIPTPLAAFYKISGLSALFPKSRKFSKYHVAYLHKNEHHEVEILSGAFMLMERKTLLQVGGLDEDYFMYGEDIDLSYKLLKAGRKNLYYAGTRILHYKGESTKKDSINYVFVFYRAMAIFARKHFKKDLASLFSAFINMAIYARAGVAVFRRLVGRHWQMLLDFLVILGAFELATRWYADYSDKVFTEPFIYWLLPVYAAILAVVLKFSGTHDSPFKAIRFARGWTMAALLLLATYALFPESYRFSRAVIVLGVITSIGAGLLWRIAMIKLKPNWLPHRDAMAHRRLVIGSRASLERVKVILENTGIPSEFIAGVSTTDKLGDGIVCNMDQLEEAIKEFRIQEVVLDPEVCGHRESIQCIEQHGERVEFKVLNDGFMVGSNSVVAAHPIKEGNELYHIDVQPIRRNKRLFDMGWSLLLLPFLPVAMIMTDRPLGLVKNLGAVLIGTKSWVGYDPRGMDSWLPALKQGVVYTHLHTIWPGSSSHHAFKANVSYLDQHHLLRDLTLVFKHFHALGN